MHRQGGPAARGISPPDDIRHRELKWDTVSQMWVERDFKRLNADFSTKTKSNADFFGQKGSTARLGRASMLRLTTANELVPVEDDLVDIGHRQPSRGRRLP